MIIEGNPIQKEAMDAFHKGDRTEGLRLQEEFAATFRREYREKDHCPCQKPAVITATARNVWLSTGSSGACAELYASHAEPEAETFI